MWINIRTEYSFRAVYGPINKVVEKCKTLGDYAGIADIGNTFGHIKWEKACKEAGIKPIFGVSLYVSDLIRGVRRYDHNLMTFIALNTHGLQEIYELVDLAHQQFYYRPRISYSQLNQTSSNIVVLSGVAPKFDKITRKVFFELSPCTPLLNNTGYKNEIASIDNYYINKGDQKIYEPLVDSHLRERKTTPIHILSQQEWLEIYSEKTKALKNLKKIGKRASAELKKAPMVSFPFNIKEACLKNSKKVGVDLKNKKYKKRFNREIKLIEQKKYTDYFGVVYDLIRNTKDKMLIGPGRGSAAGSLVCFLLGITTIDPLKYDLFFERFIDINRDDLPDIDIDFPDDKRNQVIKYLQQKYGQENVAQIGNISRLKPRAAIIKLSKALKISEWEVEELKESLISRPPGDKRANNCIQDTFETIDIGKTFIKAFPQMKVCEEVETHASHSSIHAAGLLVCNKPITNFAGIDSRESRRIAMVDKKDAEAVNLLKIDALGLRTLSILSDICTEINKPFSFLHSLPLDDKKTYKLLNSHRYAGIFQFEGESMQRFAKQVKIENIEDISALTSISRPGPMVSGGADQYIKRKKANKAEFLSTHEAVVNATRNTFGVLVYQEQVLTICREYGLLSWEDTGTLRKALSKSMGKKFFDPYWKKFLKGAKKQGRSKKEAQKIWENIRTFGGYGFNKAHAISYAMVSYICSYCKAHYPKEFAVACLNHSKSDRTSLLILRDIYENEKIKYKPFDLRYSQKKWSFRKKTLYASLTTINGIGPANVTKIIRARETGGNLPQGIQKHIEICDTPFLYIYPANERFGNMYKQYGLLTISQIKSLKKDTEVGFLGVLRSKMLRDANEATKIVDRGSALSGPTAYLNLKIEDDTDIINCTINRFDYSHLGSDISENGKEDKTWYLIKGKYSKNIDRIFVQNIMVIY